MLYIEDEPLNVVLMEEVFRGQPGWTLQVERDGARVPLQRAIYDAAYASWLAPRDASLAFALSFVLFWFARVSASLALQMMVVAVGWQVYTMTGSALDLGLVGDTGWREQHLRVVGEADDGQRVHVPKLAYRELGCFLHARQPARAGAILLEHGAADVEQERQIERRALS